MNLLKVIFASTFSGYVQKFVHLLVTVITLPIILNDLGKIEYGIYVLIGQTVGFIALSDIGIKNSISRFISKYNTENNLHNVRLTVNTSFFLLQTIAILIAILTLLISYWIPSLLNIDSEYHAITRIVFILNGLFLSIILPIQIGQGVLGGFQKYHIINSAEIIMSLFQLLIIYIFSFFGQLNLLVYTLIMLGSNFIMQLFLLIYSHNLTKIFPLKFIYFSKEIAKDIFNLGLSSMLTSLSGLLVSQGIIISIGIFLDTSLAGIFGVSIMIITNISYLITKMSQPMITIGSELISAKNKIQLKKITNFVMSISFTLSSFITIIFIFFGNNILRVLIRGTWNNSDYYYANIAICIMSFCITIGIPQFVNRAVFQGVGLHWQAGISKFIASIASFSIGFLLIRDGYGILGGAIGWGSVWVFLGIFYIPKLSLKFFEQSFIDVFRRSYMPGLVFSVIQIIIGYFLKNNLNNNVFTLILSISFMAIVGCITFIFINNMINDNFEINITNIKKMLGINKNL